MGSYGRCDSRSIEGMMDITCEKKYTISNVSEEDYLLLISSLDAILHQWEQVKPPFHQGVKGKMVKFLEQLENNITNQENYEPEFQNQRIKNE